MSITPSLDPMATAGMGSALYGVLQGDAVSLCISLTDCTLEIPLVVRQSRVFTTASLELTLRVEGFGGALRAD